MGIYNFKIQFRSDIEADRKRHTIRAKRKHPDKPGNLLHLYTGLRTKKSKLIKRRYCTLVQDIWIGEHGMVVIDGVPLDKWEREALAKSDGFPDFKPMMAFWDGRLPFSGDLIHWESDAEHAKRRVLSRGTLSFRKY